MQEAGKADSGAMEEEQAAQQEVERLDSGMSSPHLEHLIILHNKIVSIADTFFEHCGVLLAELHDSCQLPHSNALLMSYVVVAFARWLKLNADCAGDCLSF